MKRFKWHITLGVCLAAVSALTYGLQVRIFHDTRDTLFYMLQDFAFVPVQVLLVTLVINGMMQIREKNAMKHKMNMVIGAFFGDLGTSLMGILLKMDSNANELRKAVRPNADWSDAAFSKAACGAVTHNYDIDPNSDHLEALKKLLVGRRQVLMGFLANPNLLEHETVTEMLWAVTHLADELAARPSLGDLPKTDLAHLASDARRAFSLTTKEWLSYVRHLRDDYPYMYSLTVRVNPFDPEASAVVRS
jgi:hypothetical protein